MESELFAAFRTQDEENVMNVLRDHPEFNLNVTSKRGKTPLMLACIHGMVSAVKFLLEHHQVNVNAQHLDDGHTAIYIACSHAEVEIVKLLLKHPDVKLNLYNHENNQSPLWSAAINNNMPVVKLLIASGLDLGDFKHEIVTTMHAADTLIDSLAHKHYWDMIELLENFLQDQDNIRFKIQMELGMTKPIASKLFGMVIFLCDGLVLVKDHSSSSSQEENNETKSVKFFDIVQKFPMELQMMISNFAYGINEDLIKAADREKGLRDVARSFLQEKQ